MKTALTLALDKGYKGNEFLQMTKHLVMKSGLEMSIQAGEHSYCSPRKNSQRRTYGIYTHFEVGFPSERIESLMGYAECPDRPTESVYPYVPREVIEAIIEAHGGIA